MEVTQGTETSKYLEEKKEKSIFIVAASETERVQTKIYGFWGCGQPTKGDEGIIAKEVWKGPPKTVTVR